MLIDKRVGSEIKNIDLSGEHFVVEKRLELKLRTSL